MSWLYLSIAAFGVMVYALLHSALTADQALTIIGLSIMSTCGVFITITRFMTLRFQELRGKLELLTSQSADRIATLKDLKEKVRQD
jgi:hypothetical protein